MSNDKAILWRMMTDHMLAIGRIRQAAAKVNAAREAGNVAWAVSEYRALSSAHQTASDTRSVLALAAGVAVVDVCERALSFGGAK